VTEQTPAQKVALLTGAAGGIGLAIGQRLAREGVHLALVDIAVSDTAAARCRELGTEVLTLTADVSSPSEVKQAVAATVEYFGNLHIVANVAGICPRTGFDQINAEEWDQVLAVNLKGPFLVTQAALPALRQAGWGRVVNIASLAGQVGGIAVGAHYVASKAGLVGLTKAIALLGAADGITANAISPGIIDTEMTRITGPEQAQRYLERIPLGYMGEPEDIAEAVAFLCSDAARYITGTVIDVNGGILMR